MSDLILTRMTGETLPALYTSRMEGDFPDNERPSLPVMVWQTESGRIETFRVSDAAGPAGYTSVGVANGVALVTLLAVERARRGQGLGTRMLDALRARYADARGLLLEVEIPEEAETETERAVRERRIAFYLGRGCFFATRVASHVSFGAHLRVLILPLSDSFESLDRTAARDILAVYRYILPVELHENVVTKEVDPA